MPVFPEGRAPARIEYGIARMLAQATPTPTMDRSRPYLLLMKATESKPIAPTARHRAWVSLRPSRAARPGSANEKTKQTAEYMAKQLPAPAKPCAEAGVPGVPPNTLRATATPK